MLLLIRCCHHFNQGLICPTCFFKKESLVCWNDVIYEFISVLFFVYLFSEDYDYTSINSPW